MRPQSPRTLRLRHLPKLSRLLWTPPRSSANTISLADLRRTLTRLNIPFADHLIPDQPAAYEHRLFWTLALPACEPDPFVQLRVDELGLQADLPYNLRLVSENDTWDACQAAMKLSGPVPDPKRCLKYSPASDNPDELVDAFAALQPGQGLQVRMVAPAGGIAYGATLPDAPPAPEGFIRLQPSPLAPHIQNYWRISPRKSFRAGQGVFTMIAAAMGNGDSVLCPEGVDRNYANTLCQALARADRPNAVQRTEASGRIRVWATEGNPSPEHFDGQQFQAGAHTLTLERGIPISRRAYTRKAKAPFVSSFKDMKKGEVQTFGDREGDARALCMSLRRRGWAVRVGVGVDDQWYVKCLTEPAAPAQPNPASRSASVEVATKPASNPASNPEPPPPKQSEAPAPSPNPPTAAEPNVAAEVRREPASPPESRPAGRLPLPDIETDLRDGESREFDVRDKAAAREFAARQMAKGICVEHRVSGPVEGLRRRVTRIDVNAGLDVIFGADDPVMLKASAAFAKKEAVREAARAARKEADHG